MSWSTDGWCPRRLPGHRRSVCSADERRFHRYADQKRSCIAVNGSPSHSYGVSLAIWDHTVLPANVKSLKDLLQDISIVE